LAEAAADDDEVLAVVGGRFADQGVQWMPKTVMSRGPQCSMVALWTGESIRSRPVLQS
jgi:hypothetical protein